LNVRRRSIRQRRSVESGVARTGRGGGQGRGRRHDGRVVGSGRLRGRTRLGHWSKRRIVRPGTTHAGRRHGRAPGHRRGRVARRRRLVRWGRSCAQVWRPAARCRRRINGLTAGPRQRARHSRFLQSSPKISRVRSTTAHWRKGVRALELALGGIRERGVRLSGGFGRTAARLSEILLEPLNSPSGDDVLDGQQGEPQPEGDDNQVAITQKPLGVRKRQGSDGVDHEQVGPRRGPGVARRTRQPHSGTLLKRDLARRLSPLQSGRYGIVTAP